MTTDDDIQLLRELGLYPFSRRQARKSPEFVSRPQPISSKDWEKIKPVIDRLKSEPTIRCREQQRLEIAPGAAFILRGLIAVVLMDVPSDRVHVVYSNATENYPLRSSFRKALRGDDRSRYINLPKHHD